MTESPLVDSSLVIPVLSPRDDPIACLNKAMTFLTAVASSRFPSTTNQLRTFFNLRNQATIQDSRVTVQQPKRPRNATWFKDKAMLAEAQEAGHIIDEEQLAFLADPGIPDGQVVEIIIPNNVPHSETYLNNDMKNQSVHAMQDFKQTPVETVQDTNLQEQQDSMILSVIKQMSEQMINHVNNWEKANKEQYNESVTAEPERYKERIKTSEQRLNIDLSNHEKMI
ncbi:hypothetical protein Tco_1357247 [Tanacetum coccineum]